MFTLSFYITIIFKWIKFILPDYYPAAFALDDLSTKCDVCILTFSRVNEQNSEYSYFFVTYKLVCRHNELLSLFDFYFIVFSRQRARKLRPVRRVEPVAPAEFLITDHTVSAHRFALRAEAVLACDFESAVVLEAVADEAHLQVVVVDILPPKP